MNFDEALEKLGISDYAEAVFTSNSHGELFHLNDYITVAGALEGDLSWFRPWFEAVVKWAEENWNRPASMYQHLVKLLNYSNK